MYIASGVPRHCEEWQLHRAVGGGQPSRFRIKPPLSMTDATATVEPLANGIESFVPAVDDADETTNLCFVCSGGAEVNKLLSTGCGCRGSLGMAHLSCLVQWARADEKSWDVCPTCGQNWTGQMALGIARAQVELASSLPEADYARLRAAWKLGIALQTNGHLHEALQLGRATLEKTRQAIEGGRMDPDDRRLQDLMLDVMGFVGNVYLLMGNPTATLPLQMDRVATSRRTLGDDAEGTVVAIAELGVVYSELGNHAAALPLMQESLERSRRMKGNDNVETISCMNNLATLLADMGNNELAVPLLTDVLETRRRVLGRLHPDTALCAGNLGRLHHISGHFADAQPLLEEALAGLTVAYGEDHHHTRQIKAMLDDLRKDMNDPEVVARVEAYLHHQRLQAQQRGGGSNARASDNNIQLSGIRSTVLAHVVSTKPELSGRESMVLEYSQDKKLYSIVMRPKGQEASTKNLCKPSSLRFTVGTHTIAVDLIKSPELNGRLGLVEGFDKKRGRYCVRLEGRATVAMLKPDNCRAAVPGSGALSDQQEQGYRSALQEAFRLPSHDDESYVDGP
eukprot:SAG31_NODE_4305_length_3369_cov_10.152599_2_plen_568_part_00